MNLKCVILCLGISKSNFSTTRLELENIILSNIIILCFHCIFRDFKLKYSTISPTMVAFEAIILSGIYIFQVFFHSILRDSKLKLPKNFSNYGGMRSHHILKRLSVNGLHIVAGKLFTLYVQGGHKS